MKVVRRAFELLDLLRHFEEMPLRHIAASLGVRSNTAWNLLHCLRGLGYVEKARGGVYRIGHRHRALAAAGGTDSGGWLEKELSRLSTTVKESSVMARLRRNQLEVVSDVNYEGELVVRNRIYEREDALYCWACGHALLAWSPELIVKGVLSVKGLPSAKQWSGVQTPKRFWAELGRIREAGIAERHPPGLLICSIAVPCVMRKGELLSIGISYPGVCDSLIHRKAIIANLKLTAERISQSPCH